MPTIIGVIFFLFGAYFFLWQEGGLLGLLIISSIFQASSGINIAERGIQPYYIIAAFIIARALINRALGIRFEKSTPQSNWLLIFGVIAVASAFVLPVVFAGIPVYDPKIGIDDGLLIHPPLSLGLNNLAQAGFLIWHLVTAYALLAINLSAKKTRKLYIIAFYLLVSFIFAQSLCQVVGIKFPDSLIRNNPGYAIADLTFASNATRIPGTFTEPSFAGAFLVFYCVGFIAEYFAGKGSSLRVVISLLACGLVASSGSLAVLPLCILALLICYSPFRFPWYINVRQTKKLTWILFLIAVPIAIALIGSSNYRNTLMTVTVSKGDTGSFINRTASDLYALGLLLQTHFIGVGLGSNRASSLITSLLSNIGVVGFMAFGFFYFRLFANLSKQNAWLKWAAFALIMNMCIDVPDVTFPTLWIAIFIAIQFSDNENPVRQIPKANDLVFAHL
jgi:hypothetical protein